MTQGHKPSSPRRAPAIVPRLATAALMALAATPALAGGSGMPWEGPLQQIVDSFTGPVAQAGGVIAVTIFGLAVAFSEAGSGLRRGVSVLFGIAIAFAAASFFMGFFGFGGGATVG